VARDWCQLTALKILVDTTHKQNKTQISTHSEEATAAQERISDTRGLPNE